MSTALPEFKALEEGWKREIAKAGRPTDYSIELASKVLEQIAQGRPIREFTREDWCPTWSTIYLWMKTHLEFSHGVSRAREFAAARYAEEAAFAHQDALGAIVGDRSDAARVNAYRLKFEGMRWLAGVLDRQYADKQVHQHTGNVGVNVSIGGLDDPIDVQAETVTDSVTEKLTR